MCDYSLYGIENRLAEEGEAVVLTKMSNEARDEGPKSGSDLCCC